jgi:cytochrome c553
MSALSDRLSEDDFRELARIVRGIHARAAAKRERLERERAEREQRQAASEHREAGP